MRTANAPALRKQIRMGSEYRGGVSDSLGSDTIDKVERELLAL